VYEALHTKIKFIFLRKEDRRGLMPLTNHLDSVLLVANRLPVLGALKA
jgi:hypothetical protein